MSIITRLCMTVMLALALIGTARAEDCPADARCYTVKRGDWLAKIARKHGRSDYLAIAKENGIDNPNRIAVGQVIVIRKGGVGVQAQHAAPHAAAASACTPKASPDEIGIASWYGEPFHGRTTASSEIYDMWKLTVAHPTLPFGTKVCVTRNNRSVVARVNDRGPFIKPRIIDVSRRVAELLHMKHAGIARVTVSVIELPTGPPPRAGAQLTRTETHGTHTRIERASRDKEAPPRITSGHIDTTATHATSVRSTTLAQVGANLTQLLPPLREEEEETFQEIASYLRVTYPQIDANFIAHAIVLNRRPHGSTLAAADPADSEIPQP